MFGAAAFGHYINDVFDLTDDLIAGKANKTRFHTTGKKWAIALGLVVVSLVPWLLLPTKMISLILVVVHLLVFLLYSIPPIRLKESGVLGVIADAVYAHVIPGLVVVTTLYTAEADALLIGLFVAWQFFIGVRNILNHHIDDYVFDVRSETTTTATIYGVKPLKKAVKLCFIPLEIIALLTMLYVLGPPFQYGIWVFLGYVVYTFNREATFLRGKMTDEVVVHGRYDYLSGIMLNEFYEKWLPLILLGLLISNAWFWAILLGIHVVLFIQLMLSFDKDLNYFKYLVREIVRTIYFGIEKYVRHFFQSTLPSIRDIGYWEIRKFFQRIYYSLFRAYWRVKVFFRRLYWGWIRFYRNEVVRVAWIFIKFYYRVEYKLWKMFYKPLKDRWKSGK